MGKAEFLEKLADVAGVVVDAEALGDDPLEIDPPPAHEAVDFPIRTCLDDPGELGQLIRILEWSPSLSRGGVSAHALDHGAHTVRALRREMLLQTERAKGAQGIDGENLLWRPIREKRDRDRDQPANDVRVAVAAIMQDHLAVGARSRLAFQPYLTDAAPHLVAFIVGRLAKGLEGMTEFNDIAIAILPIVEGGEIVADGLEISQAILA